MARNPSDGLVMATDGGCPIVMETGADRVEAFLVSMADATS
jgi:hypothetical protein